jgi:hypothetical protein
MVIENQILEKLTRRNIVKLSIATMTLGLLFSFNSQALYMDTPTKSTQIVVQRSESDPSVTLTVNADSFPKCRDLAFSVDRRTLKEIEESETKSPRYTISMLTVSSDSCKEMSAEYSEVTQKITKEIRSKSEEELRAMGFESLDFRSINKYISTTEEIKELNKKWLTSISKTYKLGIKLGRDGNPTTFSSTLPGYEGGVVEIDSKTLPTMEDLMDFQNPAQIEIEFLVQYMDPEMYDSSLLTSKPLRLMGHQSPNFAASVPTIIYQRYLKSESTDQ